MSIETNQFVHNFEMSLLELVQEPGNSEKRSRFLDLLDLEFEPR